MALTWVSCEEKLGMNIFSFLDVKLWNMDCFMELSENQVWIGLCSSISKLLCLLLVSMIFNEMYT
jgi:hypothetical protein